MKTLFFAAALSGTMLAGMIGTAVVAQPSGGAGPGGMMMRADTNGDGVISHAEWLAAAAARFERMDANHDGKLDGDERRGRGGEDGAPITKEAFMAESEARFAKLDTNHDGRITKDEMQAMMERLQERRAAGGHGEGAPPPPGGAPGGRDGMKGPHHMHGDLLARLDANHDGRISREEMRAEADKRFDKLDTNHDGFLDKAELDAAHDRRMKHREERRGGMKPNPGQ